MEFEYWWLLGLPLFFGLGWVAARIDIRQCDNFAAAGRHRLFQNVFSPPAAADQDRPEFFSRFCGAQKRSARTPGGAGERCRANE
jgi:hypothetical protein